MPQADKELPLWAVLLSIAATILVTATISVAIFQGPSQLSKEYVTAKAEYHAAKCDIEETVRFGSKHSVGPFKKDAEAKYGEDDARAKLDKPNHCDLAAQYLAASSAEATADFTAMTVWLTAIGVGLLAWTLKSTRDTLKEAKAATMAAEKTADVTREVGEAAERAGLFVSKISNIDESNTAIEVNIEHFGKSTAHNVAVVAKCNVVNPTVPMMLSRIASSENSARRSPQSGEALVSISSFLLPA